VRDVVASHNKMLYIFERIHFFLQRLNIYTGIPLTNELTELLGKIMAQLLCILALSTKAMKERRMSELIYLLCPFPVDYGTEKILKRLVGRTDVEDALERLDTLTKEEISMTVARNLEVTDRIDGNAMAIKDIVLNVDGNVNATKELAQDVDSNVKLITEVIRDVEGNVEETRALTENVGDDVKVIQGVVSSIDHNVKATKNGMQYFLSVFMHVSTFFFSLPESVADEVKRLLLPHPVLSINADAPSQGTNCKTSFEHGSLLQIRLSIIILHVKLNTVAPEHGLPKAVRSENGRRTDRYCGSVEIVCFSQNICLHEY